MNLSELIRRFRVLADDSESNTLFADDDIIDWLNDAQAQACVRGRLLLEDSNPAMCSISVVAGIHTYPLHPLVYEIEWLGFKANGETRMQPLHLKSRGWLQETHPDWRDGDRDLPYAIQGETTIRLATTPKVDGVLTIEAYRLPRKTLAQDADKPEIHLASHEHLIHWALHRAFSVPDSEAFDPKRSTDAEAAFTSYFGRMPDSDMRRITREDKDHVVKVYP